ncbi:MAG: hypothetical protein KKB79_01675 [Nanoarchaeota archaeon]|nr:hypothetical protein [Nanoarchaeota archaeon]
MYLIKTRNRKVKAVLEKYISSRSSTGDKLGKLKIDPRRENGAHPLKGKLAGKWVYWLGANIRMVYKIDDVLKLIIVEFVGSHKVY